jgi:hypothetical protein
LRLSRDDEEVDRRAFVEDESCGVENREGRFDEEDAAEEFDRGRPLIEDDEESAAEDREIGMAIAAVDAEGEGEIGEPEEEEACEEAGTDVGSGGTTWPEELREAVRKGPLHENPRVGGGGGVGNGVVVPAEPLSTLGDDGPELAKPVVEVSTEPSAPVPELCPEKFAPGMPQPIWEPLPLLDFFFKNPIMTERVEGDMRVGDEGENQLMPPKTEALRAAGVDSSDPPPALAGPDEPVRNESRPECAVSDPGLDPTPFRSRSAREDDGTGSLSTRSGS